MSVWQLDVVFAMSLAMLVMIVAGLVDDWYQEKKNPGCSRGSRRKK